MKQIVDQALSAKIGAPTTFKNMTVFPLIGGQGTAADYLTLDEALAQKLAAITEVSEGGSVPELKFVNSSDKKVFLLDGEELVGAKQNRVLNLSIMVPVGKTLVVPVSCVEAGRSMPLTFLASITADHHLLDSALGWIRWERTTT